MPVIRFNGSTNYNASDVARRAQARTVFADSLVKQKTLDQSCLNRIVSGPAPATSYNAGKVQDQRVGAVFTTPTQAATIVTESPCVPK
jgi:hypothetical protein